MSIVHVNLRKNIATDVLNPTVTVRDMTIRVAKFDFKVDGVRYTLEEDEEHVLTADPKQVTGVCGYLVLNHEKAVRVLVDEVVYDGIDEPFKWKGSPYKYLGHLFDIILPAGVTDLESVKVVVRRFVPAEVPSLRVSHPKEMN